MFQRAGYRVADVDFERFVAEAIDQFAERYRSEEPTPATRAILTDAGFDLTPLPDGTLDEMVARQAAQYATFLATSYTVTEAARVLHVDRSRVLQRITDRSLYAVKTGREWRLPRWQFTEAGVVPGLAPVIAVLVHDGVDPLSVTAFLTDDDDEFVIHGEPVSPLRWLAAGRDPAPVAAAAQSLSWS
jgi:excisionase family DNA binding protein